MKHIPQHTAIALAAALLAACGTQNRPAPQSSAQTKDVVAHQTPQPHDFRGLQSEFMGVVAYEARQMHDMPAAYAAPAAEASAKHTVAGKRAFMVRPPAAPVLPRNTERYAAQDPNPVRSVAQEPVSTFSIDVDTGSYANTRRLLNNGNLPPAAAVRTEEIVNYFDYAYPQPQDGKPFAVNIETADSPWQPQAKLIRIGIKAKDTAVKTLPPANLVFLIDVSGSMSSEDKLPLVKKTLQILTEQLRPQDKVTLITYASGEKLLLPATSDKQKILAAINSLEAGGATHGEQAIQMAYREAGKHYIKNGINRILLATDGDFNVGITDFDTLKNLAAEKRKSGISLTTLGYGTGNYNDRLMEQLADAGDGNHSYIDNPAEARKVVQRQLSSTLATVAQDVKIQVEFNPAAVKEYRLVGYENRALRQEDFNNDNADAGDIGAGHSVTALYEIIPAGAQGWLGGSRYPKAAPQEGSLKEYGYLKLRYKLPGQSKSLLTEQPIPARSVPLAQASRDTRWATAAASYAQMLQGGRYNGSQTWDGIAELARANAQPDPYGLHAEFLELIAKAKRLSPQRPDAEK